MLVKSVLQKDEIILTTQKKTKELCFSHFGDNCNINEAAVKVGPNTNGGLCACL